jgi:hypothetical protein
MNGRYINLMEKVGKKLSVTVFEKKSFIFKCGFTDLTFRHCKH